MAMSEPDKVRYWYLNKERWIHCVHTSVTSVHILSAVQKAGGAGHREGGAGNCAGATFAAAATARGQSGAGHRSGAVDRGKLCTQLASSITSSPSRFRPSPLREPATLGRLHIRHADVRFRCAEANCAEKMKV